MFWDTLSTFVGIIGAAETSSAQQKAAQYNRNNALFNQAQTLNDGQIEADQQRLATRQNVAQITANVGASGLDMSGSAFDLIYSNMYQGNLNAQITTANANAKAAGYGRQAAMYGTEEADAQTSGYINAATVALKGQTNSFKNSGTTSGAGQTPFSL